MRLPNQGRNSLPQTDFHRRRISLIGIADIEVYQLRNMVTRRSRIKTQQVSGWGLEIILCSNKHMSKLTYTVVDGTDVG